MSTASYERMMMDTRVIERQTEAELAFAKSLEEQGVDPMQFMEQWKITCHQFNTLAHYLYDVNDEELILPPSLKAFMFAVQKKRAA
jgi:hypothetical protein